MTLTVAVLSVRLVLVFVIVVVVRFPFPFCSALHHLNFTVHVGCQSVLNHLAINFESATLCTSEQTLFHGCAEITSA
jgi:hypothetical protein